MGLAAINSQANPQRRAGYRGQGLSVLPSVISSPSAVLRINTAKQSLPTLMKLLRACAPRNDIR